MKFMLIIITIGGGYGVGANSSYVPFRSMEACEYALNKTQQIMQDAVGNVHAFCAYGGDQE